MKDKLENHETNLLVLVHENKLAAKLSNKKLIQNKINEYQEAQIYEMKKRNRDKDRN